jgi:archaellum component FlaC
MAKTNINTPKVNLNGLTGTTDDIISKATTLVQATVDNIIAPFSALCNTIRSTSSTAKTAVDTAKKAYIASKVSNPKIASKLLKASEKAEVYYDKLNSYNESLTGTYDQVLEYKKDIDNIIKSSGQHSKEWISDQVNSLLDSINNQINSATDLINEKINNLSKNTQKKAEAALEKEKNKLEEKTQQKTEQIKTRTSSDTQQKQYINKLKNNAPKGIF